MLNMRNLHHLLEAKLKKAQIGRLVGLITARGTNIRRLRRMKNRPVVQKHHKLSDSISLVKLSFEVQ